MEAEGQREALFFASGDDPYININSFAAIEILRRQHWTPTERYLNGRIYLEGGGADFRFFVIVKMKN
jgi:hypothetical protein